MPVSIVTAKAFETVSALLGANGPSVLALLGSRQLLAVGGLVGGVAGVLMPKTWKRFALCTSLGLLAGWIISLPVFILLSGLAGVYVGDNELMLITSAILMLGTLIGALAGVWWARRTQRDAADADDAA